MLDHQHGDAELLADVADPPGHVFGLLDVEAGRRFVEQQQLGAHAQRARHLDHLAHAIRQPVHERITVVLQVEQVDHALSLLAGLQLGAPRCRREEQVVPEAARLVHVVADQQVLQHRGILEQLDVLEGARNAEPGDRMGRHVVEPAALEFQRAAGGLVDAADQVEHRGLAGAVGADQREHLAAAHVEAHLVDREHATEANAEVAGREQHVAGAHFSRSDLVKDFCRLNIPLR